MSETSEFTESNKRSAASNFLPIVRGRLPLLFVHAIRFNEELAAMSTKDLASKFSTSVGKVFDIRKNRNFTYVDANYKPTAEDVTAAESWISDIGGENSRGLTAQGDKALLQALVDEYKSRGLASAQEAEAQASARTTTRKPREKAEGGKSEGAPASEKPQTQAAAAGDDLLS